MRRGASTEGGARPGRSTGRHPGLGARLLAAAVLVGLAPGFAQALEFRGLRVEASYTSDDNVTRASGEGNVLKDSALGVRVSTSLIFPISTRTRAVVQGLVGTQRFHTYKGLTNNFIGAQGDFQFRPSAEFGAPTYSAFVRTAMERYDSTLRDGYRHAYGVTVLKPWTDRVQVFGAIGGNISDGKSAVFDTGSVSLRGNVDWSLTRWQVVYFGAEYRRGDTVSTTGPTLDVVPSPNVPDDAFDDAVRTAYRSKANTVLTTLGYNFAFGEGHSVDASWRRVRTTPQETIPGWIDLSYTVNQVSLAYLARF